MDDGLLVPAQQVDELAVEPAQPDEPAAKLAVPGEKLARARHLLGIEVGERASSLVSAREHVVRTVLAPGPADAGRLAAQAVAGEERALELLAQPQEQADERRLLAQTGTHLLPDRLRSRGWHSCSSSRK